MVFLGILVVIQIYVSSPVFTTVAQKLRGGKTVGAFLRPSGFYCHRVVRWCESELQATGIPAVRTARDLSSSSVHSSSSQPLVTDQG